MAGTQPTVLMVDDENMLQAYAPKFIEADISILTAKNESEGLELAKSEQPDLILINAASSAGKNDDASIAVFRDSPDTHNIPLVLIVSEEGPEEELRAKNLGATGIIGSDGDPEQATERILGFLDASNKSS